MPARKSLISTLWLTSLLAIVLAAPVWMSAIAPRPAGMLHDLALLTVHSTPQFSAAVTTDAVLHVSALLSEDEEQEQDWADALSEPCVPFLSPCAFRKIFDRPPIAPRSILSHYPIRC